MRGPVAPMSDADCPYITPCDDAGADALLRLPPPPEPLVTLAVYKPLLPGCPTTLQVMARLHPIVFQAVRPDDSPDAPSDPSDWACEPPEAPLLRAGRHPEQNLAVR